jgi:toxin ParE1/3/4
MKVDITSAAAADLEAIADYIARDSPLRASRFVRELHQCCLDIAAMPQAWPVVPRYRHHDIRGVCCRTVLNPTLSSFRPPVLPCE